MGEADRHSEEVPVCRGPHERADADMIPVINREASGIKESMHINPQGNIVLHMVAPFAQIGLNVDRLHYRMGSVSAMTIIALPFASDYAAS